jgi:hypothetical protein
MPHPGPGGSPTPGRLNPGAPAADAIPNRWGSLALRELSTPFRDRHERALSLDLQAQIEECADYLQHPEVLIAEFLESYYLVERKLDPERLDSQMAASAAAQEELVLEPFFDSLELRARAGRKVETIRCMAGAFDPLPGEQHPALERRGIDYIGVRDGTRRVVIGVTDEKTWTTAFCLLLRGLNCLAELSVPFQVARLRRHVLRDRVDPEPAFDLQLGIAASRAHTDGLSTSLLVLTRDLAEVFKARIEAEPQFEGAIGRIECLELPDESATGDGTLRVRWRV